jgi:hypothetical protein
LFYGSMFLEVLFCIFSDEFLCLQALEYKLFC